MSAQQTGFLLLLFSLVVIFGVVIISLSYIIRRRRQQAFEAGPGHPTNPAPQIPFHRFCGALSAPYSRAEIHRTRGASRSLSNEQVYFGFGSALPWHTVHTLLRSDWGVKTPAHAVEQLDRGTEAVLEQAAGLIAVGGIGEGSVEKLWRAGAPVAAVERFCREVDATPAGDADRADLAVDIARVVNLARWSGYSGYIDASAGRVYLDLVGIAAAGVFHSWEDYGHAYATGLGRRPLDNTGPLIKAVDWLQEAPGSPWRQQPWITTGREEHERHHSSR